MSELLELPRLPRHVLMPTANQIAVAQDFGIIPSKNAVGWTLEDCETCGGSGSFRAWGGRPGDINNILEYRCPCREQLRLRRWMASHGVPPSFHHYTLAHALGWEPSDPRYQYLAKMLVRIEDERQLPDNTILYSPTPHTGKTLLSVLLMKALLKQGFDAHFVQSSSLGRMVTMWGGESGVRVRSWWTKRIRSADVVIIDDLGREPSGDQFTRERIADLIRHRTSLGLPWIISTNYDPRRVADAGSESQFVIRYGEETRDLMVRSADIVDFVRVPSFDAKPIADLEKDHNVARPSCFLAVNG